MSSNTAHIPAAPAVPLRERINWRIVGFITVVALLVGFPLYTFVDMAISGGIKNRGDYYEVDLKAMSVFPFDQQLGRLSDIPETWRNLDGKSVLMEGEIAPGGLDAGGLGQRFDLVYSVSKCCFSGPPQVQHFVKVTVPPDALVRVNHDGAVKIRGTLKVDVTRDPETGKINGVYHVLAREIDSI